MSVVDSEAVFKSRASAIKISDEVQNLLKDAGIATMGNFAFASSYVPGSSDDAPFTDLVKKALKREPSLGELAGLRRLFNESYAATAAEMKTMVEQSDEGPVRRLAPAERAERFQEQQARLKGLNISGQLEPRDSLVDAAVAIHESDRLRYIEWQHCVSREHEILTSTKKDSSLTFDSNGVLKLTKREQVSPCDASSDLQVKYCLTRRGLALEQANVMSYANHEQWAERLFACRLKEPPPGYSRVSFKQLQLADAKLFVVLGEKTRKGIKTTSGGRPCDVVFAAAMESPEVLTLFFKVSCWRAMFVVFRGGPDAWSPSFLTSQPFLSRQWTSLLLFPPCLLCRSLVFVGSIGFHWRCDCKTNQRRCECFLFWLCESLKKNGVRMPQLWEVNICRCHISIERCHSARPCTRPSCGW